jgi:S1-C subfamily serine protease
MRRPLVSLCLAAVLGGGVSAGVLIASGAVRATTTTVIRPAALANPAAHGRESGLTVREIYRRAAPGVVFVRAMAVSPASSPFDVFPDAQENVSTGSGLVLDTAGHILTNEHVVAHATDVRVSFGDGRATPAQVIGRDPDTDLAILKVPADERLRPLELGDSSVVQVGDPTVAIGNPFGLDRTLTTGVVSALQRRIEAPTGFAIEDVIQTDAAINPGNSGGPLLDAAGQVIGINSQIATAYGAEGSVGIGFAVPIDTAKEVIPQLKAAGRVSRPYLGIQGAPGADGVAVSVVATDSPAWHAGIRAGVSHALTAGGELAPLDGDVLVEIAGRAVRTMDDVDEVVAEHQPGDTVDVTVKRGADHRTVPVRLTERPVQAVIR